MTAQGTSAVAEYFPPAETHYITARDVSQTYKIQVMRPLQSRHETRSFPVVYATDGNAIFDTFKGIASLMQAFDSRAPKFILVAIGYPSDAVVAGETLRGRDLTFPGCPNWFAGFEYPWEGVLAPPEKGKLFSGAEDFQRFIAEDLFPFVDSMYETLPASRTYFGHSVGGAFGLYTLFTRHDLFGNYIISSPALAYHGRTAAGVPHECNDFMFEYARRFFDSRETLLDHRLYMSVGGREEFEKSLVNWRFTSSFYRFVAFLESQLPRSAFTFEVFQEESHATAWPISFMHGLQAVL